jgi:hypothetical protein
MCAAGIAIITIALCVTACDTSTRAAGRSPVVSVSGRVGPLRVDHSDRSEVVAFAGRSNAERRGRSVGTAPFPSARYDALGYGCGRKSFDDAFPLVRGGPWCRTVFFIDARSGRLGLFYTTQSRYREGHGVRVGMPTAAAQRLLGGRRLHVGCEANIYLSGPNASLTVAFGGRALRTRHDRTVSGGHVYALVLHGLHHDPGVFECA